VNCCSSSRYGQVFDEALARRDAARYRRRGLQPPAQWIVDAVVAQGLAGTRVLEVGGGVGAIQLELLKAGAERTVNVEYSPGYEAAAAELAEEAGLAGHVDREIGDFAQNGRYEEADVVLMHRVVCCYPDYERLVGQAARHTRQVLVFTFPPRNLLSRLINGSSNLWMRMRKNEFRSYVHPPESMIDVARRHGLEPVARRRRRVWLAVAFARPTR
jgi:2-polyprenyl-3-methyl-5-hydroxy-6-metoxy-1,4-benzoquinol methylase